MLMTYSITKAKRALGDVAQFVAQHFDHCNAAYRCRQEYRPRLTTFVFFLPQYQRQWNKYLSWQLKTATRTWKCTRCIMQISCLYASDFAFKNFYKTRLICRNNTKKCLGNEQWHVLVVGKSTDHDKPHFDLLFTTMSTSKKMFFFRARAKKVIASFIAWHIDASSVVWTLKDFCFSNVLMLCYKTNGKRHSVYYWVMVHLGGLLSTQEARVALGCRLVRLLRFFRA